MKPEVRPAPRVVGLLFFLVAAGCVGAGGAPPHEPVAGVTQGGAVGVEPAVQPSTASTKRPTDQGVAKTDAPGAGPSVAKPTPKIPAPLSTAEQARNKESIAPGPGRQEAPPPLDLASLEQRLRDTKAIGVFTKISLKNQVDDLLTQFRAFHQGRAGAVLSELRDRYNLLLLKVLSLLQGSDPVLAQAVATSREAIWGLLADPVKFATL
jgi:hypothetical protein